MPVVPIAQNRVGIADVTGAKLVPADYSGTGLQAAGTAAGELAQGLGQFADAQHENDIRLAHAGAKTLDNGFVTEAQQLRANYLATSNLDAGVAKPGVDQALRDLRARYVAQATTPLMKRMLTEVVDERQAGLEGEFQSHYLEQTKHAEFAVSTSREKLAGKEAEATTDPATRRLNIDTGRTEIASRNASLGLPAEVTTADQFTFESGVHTSIAHGKIASGDIDGAIAYRDQNKDHISRDDLSQIDAELRGPIERRDTVSQADRFSGAATANGPSRFSYTDPLHGAGRAPVAGGQFNAARDYGGHQGVDIPAPLGTAVYATLPGVAKISHSELGGTIVTIDHGGGVISKYDHLGKVNIQDGQQVTPDTILGAVGVTGRTTGPHLHWEVRQNGKPVDPETLLGRPGGGPVATPGAAVKPPVDPYSDYPIVTNPDKSTWDKRGDGSEKGTGFLGLRKRPDGTVSSELSIGVEWDGVEHEIPTMVPGLTKGEMHYLMTTSPDDQEKTLPASIKQKAVAFAKSRIAQGLSPFKQPEEGDYSPPSAPVATQATFAAHQSPTKVDLNGQLAAVDRAAGAEGWAPERIDRVKSEIERRASVNDRLLSRQQDDAKDQAYRFINTLPDGITSINQVPGTIRANLSPEVTYSLGEQARTNARELARQMADLNAYRAGIAAPGFAWNPFDEHQQKAIEAGVKSMGGTPDAAFQVWQRTGILAKSGAVALRGGLVSTDPARVGAAANVAGNMIRRNPNAFAGVEGQKDIETAAQVFNHLTYDLGFSPHDAAARVAKENDPAMKAKMSIGQPELDAYRKQLRHDGDTGIAAQILGGNFYSPSQAKEADDTYTELAVESMREGHDQATATAMAKAQMQKVYGTTRDGHITKYAPERGYPPIDGSFDYVYHDAVQTVKSETHAKPTEVHLIPIPGVTDQDFRTGARPRYRLLYAHMENGQKIYDTVPGQFAADVPSAAKAATEKRQQGEAAARFKRQQQDAEANPLNAGGQAAPY